MGHRIPTLAVARRRARPPVSSAIASAALIFAACSAANPAVAPSASGVPGQSVTPDASASLGPGAGSASPSMSQPAPSPSNGQHPSMLLEVRHAGGFINPAATIGAVSDVVVDTDGRIYTPHPAADGKAPLIPRIDVRDTGASGASAVLAAARDAGLAAGGSAGIAGDAGSVVFTLELPGGSEAVTRVGAMGPGLPGAPGGSAGPSGAPGAAALQLLARLTDASQPWPPSATPAKAFDPTDYEVWVAPDPAGAAAAAAAKWPLSTDPNSFGSPAAGNLGIAGLRSGTVGGADAALVTAALGSVTAGADVAYQGRAYRVWVRPMLPDQSGG